MSIAELMLIGLQALQVLILWTHDWVPLGKLNDVAAVRGQDPLGQLIFVTFLQSAPFSFGLACSIAYFGQAYPHWLDRWLWISYGILFVGELQAWWIPYLITTEPKRAERYRKAYGKTHTFLPERHGLVPNTLHTILHICTAAILIVLFMMP